MALREVSPFVRRYLEAGLVIFKAGRQIRTGPLFVTATGRRWNRWEAWRTLRRLFRTTVPSNDARCARLEVRLRPTSGSKSKTLGSGDGFPEGTFRPLAIFRLTDALARECHHSSPPSARHPCSIVGRSVDRLSPPP